MNERPLPIRSATFYFGPEPQRDEDDDTPMPVPEHSATVAALALREDLKNALTWIIGLLGLLIVARWLR